MSESVESRVSREAELDRERGRRIAAEWRKRHGPPPESVLAAVAGLLRSHYQTQAQKRGNGRRE